MAVAMAVVTILTRILPEPAFINRATLYFPANRASPIAAEVTFSTGLARNDQLTAALDWRQTGPQTCETDDGTRLELSNGGSQLDVRGQPTFTGPPDEYPDIHKEFARLLDRGQSSVDASPFQLLADAFMVATGSRSKRSPSERVEPRRDANPAISRRSHACWLGGRARLRGG